MSRFVGDMNAASMPDEAFIERAGPELSRQLFVNKNVWQRISVVVAGPVANIIFTLLVLYALLLGYGRYTIPAVLDAVPVESVGRAGGPRRGRPHCLCRWLCGAWLRGFPAADRDGARSVR